ncbi:hypothetical protein H2O64_23515 [Kordia sp. YSTF-M3]|uniref:Uncharacterized protein n=1 Tax=Kordia aestuariivivens TaxID=2759037 RepID=A0ABR7QGF7_9FLAO|nr:hypothetical protein [Kordia aestuariivivens]MBC8757657.1 hypothetical protein [Kordia aestuariivivens]
MLREGAEVPRKLAALLREGSEVHRKHVALLREGFGNYFIANSAINSSKVREILRIL